MAGTPLLDELNAFYETHGISPSNFRCPWHSSCSAGSPNFTTAKASFVGPRYGAARGRVPRLVFLSADPGRSPRTVEQRTPEGVQAYELALDLATFHKARHWGRTHELAFRLLRQFKAGLTIEEARYYFAHVNSAKCCENNPCNAQASPTLFRNCQPFALAELRLLRPDIIVTQGSPAKDVVMKRLDVRSHDVRELPSASMYKRDALYETGHLDIVPGRKTLWLSTYHPHEKSGRFAPQRRHCWPRYVEAARLFVTEQLP